MSLFVDLSDLGRHRGPRRHPRPTRPPVVISPSFYPYPAYYPYSYSDLYPSPLVEEVRVVDENLDPFAEEKKAEEEKRKKAEEERKLEALKAKLKAEIKKELGLADAGMGQWRRRPPYGGYPYANPYLAQNYAAAAQRALYEALAWQYGLLPYVPPQVVTVRKVVSPQAAELDLLYSGAYGPDADPDSMGSEVTPGAKDAGFMDDVTSSAAAASVGGLAPLAAVLAGAAVAFWVSKRR